MWFCFGVFFSSFLFPAIHQNQRQAHICVMTWFHHSLCPYRRPVTPGESGKSFPFGLLVYKTDPVIAFRESCSASGAWRKGARELPERWAITDHLPGVLTFARKDHSSSGTHCISISSFFLKPYWGRTKTVCLQVPSEVSFSESSRTPADLQFSSGPGVWFYCRVRFSQLVRSVCSGNRHSGLVLSARLALCRSPHTFDVRASQSQFLLLFSGVTGLCPCPWNSTEKGQRKGGFSPQSLYQ